MDYSKEFNCTRGLRKFIAKKMLSVVSCKESPQKKRSKVQAQVVQVLEKTNYSLNVVNRYKENILHVSAANNCVDVIKCILQKHGKHCLERKNSFGWTPLMQAVRNENVEMVKFLLDSGAIVNDFSFLGLSVISLACAISKEMFDLLYNSCPEALEYAAHDDINPLCVAALKNDKELFFHLVALGLDVRKANAFTHTIMKQSTDPQIAALAKNHLSSEDYWNDISQIEDYLNVESDNNSNNTPSPNAKNVQNTEQTCNANNCIPKICVEMSKPAIIKEVNNNKNNINLYLDLKPVETNCNSKSLISPTLSYVNKDVLPTTPNTFITEDNPVHAFSKLTLNVEEKSIKAKNNNIHTYMDKTEDAMTSPLVLRRCQNKRPPNLKLRHSSNDSNATLSFTPQFTPTKSPNLPKDINEDNVFDESTPTPPKYKTPPRGIILDPSTARLMFILQRFGLKRHIPTFLEQEVDLDLFFTLTDQDLLEIGIESKSERLILLSVINECKGKRNIT
ncbi:ankyrin repeat and SAM domain-containing protein 6-like [Nasonia vitripennis]|uniref:SAM domain-containing protein n=1 Tax=Nasonia vitripennis TaxID=7425 RepID=A0A7M7GDV5_NASVI|nr:ankyrin repeat and SAM domain-containing protein 6-like [Nasonia vitripennis]